jgi:hypothetical protein
MSNQPLNHAYVQADQPFNLRIDAIDPCDVRAIRILRLHAALGTYDQFKGDGASARMKGAPGLVVQSLALNGFVKEHCSGLYVTASIDVIAASVGLSRNTAYSALRYLVALEGIVRRVVTSPNQKDEFELLMPEAPEWFIAEQQTGASATTHQNGNSGDVQGLARGSGRAGVALSDTPQNSVRPLGRTEISQPAILNEKRGFQEIGASTTAHQTSPTTARLTTAAVDGRGEEGEAESLNEKMAVAGELEAIGMGVKLIEQYAGTPLRVAIAVREEVRASRMHNKVGLAIKCLKDHGEISAVAFAKADAQLRRSTEPAPAANPRVADERDEERRIDDAIVSMGPDDIDSIRRQAIALMTSPAAKERAAKCDPKTSYAFRSIVRTILSGNAIPSHATTEAQ